MLRWIAMAAWASYLLSGAALVVGGMRSVAFAELMATKRPKLSFASMYLRLLLAANIALLAWPLVVLVWVWLESRRGP